MTEIALGDFVENAEEFLRGNASPRPPRSEFVWGEGSDNVGVFEEHDPDVAARIIAEAKAWRATRSDNGFGWINGPPEYGGRGLPSSYERAYNTAEARYITPSMSIFTISLGMVAPTILAHGTPVARDRYLRDLYRGDIIGCQLFSEPGAGSDLASLQTRALRDGDEWRITGQKVWTSNARESQIGEIICRTDPDQPKHRGLTGFIVDMTAPGVTIRPLRQMTGGAMFNEVFFDDVRVADDHRLGDVNAGWGVALTTLMNERASIGAGAATGGMDGLLDPSRFRAMLEHFGVADDPLLRQEIAEIWSHFRVASLTNRRALEKLKAGGLPGPELSTAKLALTNNLGRLASFMARVLGPRITADSGEWGTYSWTQLLLGTPGMRVAGGTDEVMRNIIAERVLGLPKDPGIDSTTPFRDLTVGTQRSAG